jgi:serine/threonine protein kinase
MLQAHERLGDFEIVRLLGKGGMGEVYEALQFNPERRVALKVLSPWLAKDDDALHRFWREAKVPANLDHPGIVRIISTGKTNDGIAFYTMQLVRGVSLAEMIRRANAMVSDLPTRSMESADTPSTAGPPPGDRVPTPLDSVPPCLADYRHDRFPTVARIGAQAARALAFAHDQGHLHRDIKPSNLMVDVHNHVYLVDFGLTRALEGGDGTQSGALVGTPWYMSPEQANGQPLDARSDIYSLGVTLFELATQGLGPFTANREDKQSVLAQVRAGQVLPLRTLAPGIPRSLEQVILRAMQHKPKRRHDTAAEMACDLEALAGNSNSRPRGKPRRNRVSRHWLLYAAGLALLLAGGTALTVLALQDRPDLGSVPAPTAAKPDDAGALPKHLRLAGLGTPVLLFNNEPRPIWSERVFGSGKLRSDGKQLELWCMPPDSVNALAIADPDCTSFEFTVEIMHFKSFRQDLDNDSGIFFGQSRDPERPSRCLLMQIDERPVEGARFGRLTLGAALLDRGSPVRAETLVRPVFDPNHAIPLSEAQYQKWHLVKLRIYGHSFVVSVDDQAAKEYLLREFDDTRNSRRLTTKGAVGIWSKGGIGIFRRATLTLLAEEKSR